ncbi:hypothetical protein ACQ4M3_22305 [Leptolyngbya sp. AN03gr2]|uniref:hypothetical protein n=1 Tax=unclassified Leptolyngbya TaxID=2650499 RepID=UPI003D3117E3
MDLLEDFFARKRLYENAIEIAKVEDTKIAELPTPALVIVIRKVKPRKLLRRPAFNRAKLAPIRSTRQWLEWVLIPLAIGQFWWLALLSLPALSAQCNPLHNLGSVDVSHWKLPNSEDFLSLFRK